MQDSAPIHSTNMMRVLLDHNRIKFIRRPPYLPDLNHIENSWVKLRERIYKLYPELLNETTLSGIFKKQFVRAI